MLDPVSKIGNQNDEQTALLVNFEDFALPKLLNSTLLVYWILKFCRPCWFISLCVFYSFFLHIRTSKLFSCLFILYLKVWKSQNQIILFAYLQKINLSPCSFLENSPPCSFIRNFMLQLWKRNYRIRDFISQINKQIKT